MSSKGQRSIDLIVTSLQDGQDALGIRPATQVQVVFVQHLHTCRHLRRQRLHVVTT